VFVTEQGVPRDEELDELDLTAIHALALVDGSAVGTGRLVLDGTRGRVGRMAVRKSWRGQGVGSALLTELLGITRAHELVEVDLAAQLHAIPFYERFGFMAQGEVHQDGGIPHRWMFLRDAQSSPRQASGI
jgi:predicted GNAT family N-acyltransferase